MTTSTQAPAARLRRHDFGRGHAYVLDCTCRRYTKNDPHKLVGVTTVLSAMAAPGLVTWAAKAAADCVVNEWDYLAELPPTARQEYVRQAPDRARDTAALRGTQIHALGEELVSGRPVDVPPEHLGPIEAYARFLDKWGIEPIATETPLASTQYGGYAGTADLWARINAHGGETALIDIKTGKGVYASTALQLAAYRFAELWQPDGPASEQPKAPDDVDSVYVAHVGADDVRLLPVVAGEREYRAFQYLAMVYRWRDRHDGFPTPTEPLILEAISA